MDLNRTERMMLAGSIFGFLVAAVGLVGEVLGWWDAWGEVLIDIGALMGIVLGVATIMSGSSRSQVRGVGLGVATANSKLDQANAQLISMDAKLDKLDKLDNLDTMDAKLDHLENLDVIEAQLNLQSGALERQVTILTQIRDRL